jgi:hypothetical protein
LVLISFVARRFWIIQKAAAEPPLGRVHARSTIISPRLIKDLTLFERLKREQPC